MHDHWGRIAIFIDGPHLHSTARTLGFEIDFKQLLSMFEGRGALVRALYYTATTEDQEFSSLRPLIDWLGFNGYTVVTKPTKEFADASGQRKVKGSMAVELAVGAMGLASNIDAMVLFSGDGDFRSLIEAMQRKGIRVIVVSSIACRPHMIGDALRRQADIFIELADLRPKLARAFLEHSAPKSRLRNL